MFYIIEHPTRGTFREWDGSTPRFSWSGLRSDPEKAYQFRTLQSALSHREQFPDNLKAESVIRSSNDFKVVA